MSDQPEQHEGSNPEEPMRPAVDAAALLDDLNQEQAEISEATIVQVRDTLGEAATLVEGFTRMATEQAGQIQDFIGNINQLQESLEGTSLQLTLQAIKTMLEKLVDDIQYPYDGQPVEGTTYEMLNGEKRRYVVDTADSDLVANMLQASERTAFEKTKQQLIGDIDNLRSIVLAARERIEIQLEALAQRISNAEQELPYVQDREAARKAEDVVIGLRLDVGGALRSSLTTAISDTEAGIGDVRQRFENKVADVATEKFPQ